MNHDQVVDQMGLLAEALNCAELDAAQRGVARQVLSRGVESLSPPQYRVWRLIQDEFLNPHCVRCVTMIPDTEVADSWSNGGFCSCCELMQSK